MTTKAMPKRAMVLDKDNTPDDMERKAALLSSARILREKLQGIAGRLADLHNRLDATGYSGECKEGAAQEKESESVQSMLSECLYLIDGIGGIGESTDCLASKIGE